MVKEMIQPPNPESEEPKRRYVAKPEKLSKHHEPFAPVYGDIEEHHVDADEIEAEAILHREIKQIESEISQRHIDRIHDEIHREHAQRISSQPILGIDHDKLDDDDGGHIRYFAPSNNKRSTGFLAEWDQLTEKQKKPFLQAPTVRRLLDFLTGRAVVEQKLEPDDKNKEEVEATKSNNIKNI